MDEILDNNLTSQNQNKKIIYGGFWPRFGALFIDGLVVGVATFVISYFNIVTWKSIPLLIVISLTGLAYKPFLEYKYGATLGKMVLNLKVVNLEYGNISLNEALMRDIFNIAFGVLSLFFAVLVYNLPEFQHVDGYMKFVELSSVDKRGTYVVWLSSMIGLVEFILLVSDDRKRSLHDRIANTYVIEKVG